MDMLTIFIFIFILSLLVAAHEFGHFITARKSGIRVYEFGLGFPPRAVGVYKDPKTKAFAWVWRRGESRLTETVGGDERRAEFPATLYSLNWLPLGGFCKIKGESGEDETHPDSFAYQKAWKRLMVLVAGVAMNVLLAAVVFSVGFGIGIPTDIGEGLDRRAIMVSPPHVVAERVENDSPAAEAGILSGDTIVALDGNPVSSAKEMVVYVESRGGREIELAVRRGEEEKTVSASPRALSPAADDVKPRLGIVLADVAVIRYPWYLAIPKGFAAAGAGLVNIFISFAILIKQLVLGRGLAFDISGPVGIAAAVGASARLGVHYLLNITAMLSLSLAAVNILPIPALDGGRALFVLIEAVARRRVPMKYEQLAHTIGFIFLMALIVVVTWRDIAGLAR